MIVKIGMFRRILFWIYVKSFGFIFGVLPGTWINSCKTVHIGHNVNIAHNVTITSSDHNLLNPLDNGVTKEVVIGDYCWIGAGSIILKGVVLGCHTVVAAGSVVTKSFPDGYCIIGGNPAQLIRRIGNEN